MSALVRFYWDTEDAFIASDDANFSIDFPAFVDEYGAPNRVRVGPRRGLSTEYLSAGESESSITVSCDQDSYSQLHYASGSCIVSPCPYRHLH